MLQLEIDQLLVQICQHFSVISIVILTDMMGNIKKQVRCLRDSKWTASDPGWSEMIRERTRQERRGAADGC